MTERLKHWSDLYGRSPLRIYVAGPMRGVVLYNSPAFDQARDEINAAGHEAISPTDLDREEGFDAVNLPRGHDWSTMPDALPKARTFVRNLKAVSECNAIALLPGWQRSEGTKMELAFARFLGLEEYEMVPPGEALSEKRAQISDSRAALLERFAGAINALHERSLPFSSILAEVMELHARKSKDYGSGDDPYANVRASEEFGVPAWQGGLIRSNDKITRLKSFAQKGSLANESAEDSLLDLCVYFPIVLMLYREASRDAA